MKKHELLPVLSSSRSASKSTSTHAACFLSCSHFSLQKYYIDLNPGIYYLCAHGPTVSFLCHCVTIPHRPLLNPSESAHPAGKRVVSRDGLGEVVYSLYLTSSVMDWWTERSCITTSCKHRCLEPCFPACVST